MSGFQPLDPRVDPNATTHHEAYADVALHTPPGCFLVPEDKSSHESYLRSEEGHLFYLDTELQKSGWTLERGVLPEVAEQETKRNMIKHLPPRFSFLTSQIRAWKGTNTPSVYCSIKRKCWDSHSRVCTDPSHACVRKIVSYAKCWGKPLHRTVHKGIQIALQAAGHTNALWNLGIAAPTIQDGVSQLQFVGGDLDLCWKCGKTKPEGLNIWGGDAGKFYETFTVEEAVAACDNILDDITEETAFSTVTVINSRRVQGHLGGH